MELSELERMLYDSVHENKDVFLTAGLENNHGEENHVYTPYSNVLPVGDAVFTSEHPVKNFEACWEAIRHVRLYTCQDCYDAQRLNSTLHSTRFAEDPDGYHPSFEERKDGVDSVWIEFPFIWYDIDDEQSDKLVKITLYPDKPSSRYSMQKGLATLTA